jgi:multidrug resistance efflux pump
MSRRANILLLLALAIAVAYGRFGVPLLLPMINDTQAWFEEPESEWELKAIILQREVEVQETEADLKRWQAELKRTEILVKHCFYREIQQDCLAQVERHKRQLANAKAALGNARARLADRAGNVVASVPAANTAPGK